MSNKNIKEGIEILKKLSPKNQTYFMTLLRLAETAENGVKGLDSVPESGTQRGQDNEISKYIDGISVGTRQSKRLDN